MSRSWFHPENSSLQAHKISPSLHFFKGPLESHHSPSSSVLMICVHLQRCLSPNCLFAWAHDVELCQQRAQRRHFRRKGLASRSQLFLQEKQFPFLPAPVTQGSQQLEASPGALCRLLHSRKTSGNSAPLEFSSILEGKLAIQYETLFSVIQNYGHALSNKVQIWSGEVKSGEAIGGASSLGVLLHEWALSYKSYTNLCFIMY